MSRGRFASCRAATISAILSAAAILPLALARADQPLPLAAAVAAAAKKEIVPALERAQIKSVGVLKFLAMDGSGPDARPSARLGAINSDLASQFQIAILLNVSRRNPIAVLRDPGAVAAGIPGATHLTADGIPKLFAAEYPVVVGQPGEKVKPDAFIFGNVQIADDLRTADVIVFIIQKDVPSAQKLTSFTAGLGADDLPAAGQSFVATRGLFTGGQTGGGGEPTPEQVAERPIKLASLAADVRAGRRAFPLEDPAAPVTLSIAYNGAVQHIEARDGGAFVAGPHQGQTVTITLKKTRQDGRRYAVALKVNGENTAERGVLPDIKGSKWILSDEYMTLPVRGYASGTNAIQPFAVLSEAESARRAFDYGVDAGTITMTVYAEETSPPADLPPESVPADSQQFTQAPSGAEAALTQLLLAGGVRLDPKQTFGNLDEAKAQLNGRLTTRGSMIVPDTKKESFEQRIVKFEPIPDPVMSVVIRYYTTP